MRIAVIGDIHGRSIWKELIKQIEETNDYNKIVFLGDYVDSFDVDNSSMLYNLNELINYANSNQKQVELLLGNHDVQYMLETPTVATSVLRCSGYRPEMHWSFYELYNKNKHLFKIAYQYDNYIFSHAGISKGWYEYSAKPQIFEAGINSDNIATQMNQLLEYQKKCLFDVGYWRGGINKNGGILWADKNETNREPLNEYHQVVGHTRVKEIKTIVINDNTSITYCDVLENEINKFLTIEL